MQQQQMMQQMPKKKAKGTKKGTKAKRPKSGKKTVYQQP